MLLTESLDLSKENPNVYFTDSSTHRLQATCGVIFLASHNALCLLKMKTTKRVIWLALFFNTWSDRMKLERFTAQRSAWKQKNSLDGWKLLNLRLGDLYTRIGLSEAPDATLSVLLAAALIHSFNVSPFLLEHNIHPWSFMSVVLAKGHRLRKLDRKLQHVHDSPVLSPHTQVQVGFIKDTVLDAEKILFEL